MLLVRCGVETRTTCTVYRERMRIESTGSVVVKVRPFDSFIYKYIYENT